MDVIINLVAEDSPADLSSEETFSEKGQQPVAEVSEQCRICLRYDDEIVDMFTIIEEFPKSLVDKYEMFSSATGVLATESDQFTTGLCRVCFGRLKDCAILRRQANQTYTKLIKFPQSENVTIETKDSKVEETKSIEDKNSSKICNTQCRICLNCDTKPVDIYKAQPEFIKGLPVGLGQMLEETTGICASEDDDFTRSLCRECVLRVKECALLLNQAQDSYTKLIDKTQRGDFYHRNKNVEMNSSPDDCREENSEENHLNAFMSIVKLQNSVDSEVDDSFEVEVIPWNEEGENDDDDDQNYTAIQEANNTTFECPHCHKAFARRAFLARHIRIHSHERDFKCTECDKAFFYRTGLKEHVRSKHTMERTFICEICSKTFARQNCFRLHIISHSNEKRYACPICSKLFKRSTTCRDHIRSHTNERPHACPMCPMKFVRLDDCKRHIRIHTNEKPYVCNVCSRRFRQCGQYKTHMRIHSDERPFVCHICGKTFNNPTTCRKHIENHEIKRLKEKEKEEKEKIAA